jgi:hypothetical protein
MRKKLNVKLKLNKETLLVLSARDLDGIYGGLSRISCGPGGGGGCSSPSLSCPDDTCATCAGLGCTDTFTC